jgi:hypothetical protein
MNGPSKLSLPMKIQGEDPAVFFVKVIDLDRLVIIL